MVIEVGKEYSFLVRKDIPQLKLDAGGIGDVIETLIIRVLSKRYDFYTIRYRLLGIEDTEILNIKTRIGERDLLRVLIENNVLP